MSSNSPIRYLTQAQIDKEKWDACIANSSNELIYGYSFYLDAMAKHWDGLVLNDYEAVMPLTWNRKYGTTYLYQPFSCALLGIFGGSVTAELTDAFLLQIPEKFRYWDINLNPGNNVNDASFLVRQRKNFILNLNRPYIDLYKNFSENIKRNIKKSVQLNSTVNSPALPEVLKLVKSQMDQFASVNSEDIDRFLNLYHLLEKENAATTYGVVMADKTLLSACIFFIWHNRAYYILAGNHPDSKSTGASHALINAFIKDHAATNMILDFEGSDIPGVALFYKSFGAEEESYPAIKLNRLPAVLKLFKK